MMNLRFLLSAAALYLSFGFAFAHVNYTKSKSMDTNETVFQAAPVVDGTTILGYSEKEVEKKIMSWI